MGKRWAFVVIAIVLCLSPVAAHKMPVIEYTYVGHLWEEAYETIPKQQVVNELITFRTSVVHPNETISGNVTGLISIYRDDTTFDWYGGKSYKRPAWLLMKEAWMRPEGNNVFTEDVVIEEPGSYNVLIDWYENRQYIGQSMHTLDVETRTIGPMYIAFNIILLLGVLLGVWAGVL